MNTPDTEWDCPNCQKDVTHFISQLLTSYEEKIMERVKGKIPNALHEYARWLLENQEADPLERRRKKDEITHTALEVIEKELLGKE